VERFIFILLSGRCDIINTMTYKAKKNKNAMRFHEHIALLFAGFSVRSIDDD